MSVFIEYLFFSDELNKIRFTFIYIENYVFYMFASVNVFYDFE